MLKRFFVILLTLLFVIPTSIISLAANPTSLEAPTNFGAYESNGNIMLRWTVPQSIANYIDSADGEVFFCIDYKIDNGAWKYETATVTESTYDPDSNLMSYPGNIVWDENRTQEVFLNPADIGLSTDNFDFANHTYTFRMRFAFYDYTKDPSEPYVTSAYTAASSVGKSATAAQITKLDSPTNLKVEVKYDENSKPYFYLTWTNPKSVDDQNKVYPIEFKVDIKVGDGSWHSVEHGHDWWSGNLYGTSINFDPVEKQLLDSIVIEQNTYYFRILYSYEPASGNNVYSEFSNIVTAGVPLFKQYTGWALNELNKAAELGIITDRIKDNMQSPITREQFAEVAVKFYEMVTGKTAVAAPSGTFADTTNPEILKAFNLGITTGAGKNAEGKDVFRPNDILIREQMAAMITRTLTACFENLNLAVTGVPAFADEKDISTWAKTSTKFMYKYNITTGVGNGNFGPKLNCSREQALAFLVRGYDKKSQYQYK